MLISKKWIIVSFYMHLSKEKVTELINKRRRASLLINIERLQRVAELFDMFYEEYWNVPPENVPQYVYRYWYMAVISEPRNPKVVGPQQMMEIHSEPKDHEWILSQLLE